VHGAHTAEQLSLNGIEAVPTAPPVDGEPNAAGALIAKSDTIIVAGPHLMIYPH
jgi:hypothetical protein